jgi:hypothetical protein
MRDQFWPNTTLLLQGNGTNGAQNNTFLDSSTNNFTITRNGNTTQGSFTPYEANGYWSNYFDGSGDYLTAPYSVTTTEWWTQDFTMEMWVYNNANAVSATNSLCLQLAHGIPLSTDTYWSFGTNASGQVDFYYFNGSPNRVTSSTSAPLSSWNHIAMVYTHSSGGIALYLNGTRVATATKSGTPQSSSGSTLNVGVAQATYYNGYISNLRILDGVAQYSGATYTVPTAPLTAISGTAFLTCQSNRFIDNSTNAFTITRNGDTSVQAFQPFPGATTWSGSVLGGSGYFDGSGDWLSAPSNAAFAWGTGSLTVECWFYLTATAQYQVFLSTRTNAGVVGSFLGIETGTSQPVWYNNNALVLLSPVAAPLNAWNHVAFVRNGTTSTIYLNGVNVASGTDTNNYAASNGTVGYDTQDNNWAFNGYISNLRAVKGSAVYTSTFTPPSAPLTAITNTSLLLNFTNAGIFDSAMMNDLETVGNAQVSTSVVKYGTGSMYFDGSGDWLASPANPNVQFGTGDFTVEAWVYRNGSQAQFVGLVGLSGAASAGWFLSFGASNVLTFGTASGTIITSSSALTNTAWVHVAVSRSGTSLRMFFDGVQVASATDSTSFTDNAYGVRVGGSSGYSFNGYIDDLRITKGAARYITNFTPPIARLPAQ